MYSCISQQNEFKAKEKSLRQKLNFYFTISISK